MSKFKVGDRVVRTSYDCQYSGGVIKVGDVGVVTSIDGVGWISLDTHPKSGATLPDYYDLALETELERLVRVANEGALAMATLATEYPNSCTVECKKMGSGMDAYNYAEYSVKPKPTFEPFYVGPNGGGDGGLKGSWLVKLEGNCLHIGCRSYNVSEVKNALHVFNAGAVTMGSFRAHRHGVYEAITPTNFISWADCDKIYQALEKAGI